MAVFCKGLCCSEVRPSSDLDYYDEVDEDASQDDPGEGLEFRRTPEEWSCPAGSERADGGRCVGEP